MEQENILKFDDKELFNNEILHQYDEDGQKGFLGYLLRYKQWTISSNKIIFPDINSKEKIEKLLAEYNTETMKNNIIVRKQVLRDVSVFGVERLEQMIKEESKEIEKREKRTKENGVRIDIWTHFMRECIINYVH